MTIPTSGASRTSTKNPKPEPFRLGDKVRILTNGGYTEPSAAGFTPGSIHEVAIVHGVDMGVSLRNLNGMPLYFSLREFERTPVANRTEPALASKARRYVARCWNSNGPGGWGVYDTKRDEFIDGSRTIARRVAAMLNAEASTTTSKRKGSK